MWQRMLGCMLGVSKQATNRCKETIMKKFTATVRRFPIASFYLLTFAIP
jgi:hypothetical protein